jgi:hypothetical protein
MDNPGVEWLGARCGALAAVAGQEIFKALGAGGNILYWSDVSNENHCSTRSEWRTPITQFIKKFLSGSGGTVDSTFHISAKKRPSLADWKDWETPTLS